MADLTREEVDAKLAVAEARAETRFVELSAKIDRINDAINRLAVDGAKNNADIKSDNKFTRSAIIVAVVGSIIAGLAALWVTQSNMLSSFQLGISLHDTEKTQQK
jgi:ATP-dependent protease HslVU (ClpYQ) peptidase subunit